jgi:catechol 2,3-dioxygenase-like lactoylglutathione lyase family enzyme
MIAREVTDFPEPDSPTRPRTSPRANPKSIARTAGTDFGVAGNSTFKFLISSNTPRCYQRDSRECCLMFLKTAPSLKWVSVNLPFAAIDHVQLAMPPSQEETARRFYADLLGMREIPKPGELLKRGGCWFESGFVEVHLGVETDFRPAKKAHPALTCTDYDGLVAKLRGSGVDVTEPADIPGVRRCHIHDPFGNRIELIALT